METYTLEQLTTLINSLAARVNIIDGQGLPFPTTGAIPNLQQQINSLTTDLSQLAASFESQLSTYRTTLTAIQNQLNILTGAPNVPPSQG